MFLVSSFLFDLHSHTPKYLAGVLDSSIWIAPLLVLSSLTILTRKCPVVDVQIGILFLLAVETENHEKRRHIATISLKSRNFCRSVETFLNKTDHKKLLSSRCIAPRLNQTFYDPAAYEYTSLHLKKKWSSSSKETL